jgi:high affinity Mn2+ porin
MYPSLISRVFLKQTVGLGGEQEFIDDGLNQIAGPQDISRRTIYAGKLAVNDLFDNTATPMTRGTTL